MITKKDVEYIAGLAQIHLKDDEIVKLTANLEGILGYVEKLSTLDVTNVEPTSHALPVKNVFRQDIVKPSFSRRGCFKDRPATTRRRLQSPASH